MSSPFVDPPALSARACGVEASAVREILAVTARPEVISFAGGLPAARLFDVEGVAASFTAVLAESGPRALQYSTTEGDPGLRGAIANRLTGRGLATGADDLLITAGSQQGLSLLATALIEPGDAVLVEDPCYLAVLQVFQLAGARIVPVPCDADGPEPGALTELVERERPKLLYTVPTFQNPTGRTVPAGRRREIATVAAERGLWVIEDDPYGELRFDGDHVPWLTSFDETEDRTVLLGSFSKIMAPGMRLGWMRLPSTLRRACEVIKQAADLHTPTVNQLAAAHYLRERDLDAHIARTAGVYASQRDALLAALRDILPVGSTWTEPEGGMFVWACLPEGYDTLALLPRAVEHDVAYVPGAPFHVAAPGGERTMRLSFVTHTTEEIAEGARRLAKVLG